MKNSNNKIVQKTYNNSIIGVNTVPYNDLYKYYQEQALMHYKFIEYIDNPIKKTLASWFLIPNLQN